MLRQRIVGSSAERAHLIIVDMRDMLRTLPLAAAMLAFFYVPPAPAQEETIDWVGDYQQAIQEAKRTNKPIFLEFRCEA
jgi:hypothetical protein